MHRFITFGCMLLATILWIAGQAANSMTLFAAAGLSELLSWKRMLARRSH
jgi:ABC-type molybdate transport system substrate-binding protein